MHLVVKESRRIKSVDADSLSNFNNIRNKLLNQREQIYFDWFFNKKKLNDYNASRPVVLPGFWKNRKNKKLFRKRHRELLLKSIALDNEYAVVDSELIRLRKIFNNAFPLPKIDETKFAQARRF